MYRLKGVYFVFRHSGVWDLASFWSVGVWELQGLEFAGPGGGGVLALGARVS